MLYWTAPAQEHVAIIYWEIGISISKRVIVTRHIAVLNVVIEYIISTEYNVRMIGRQRNLSIYTETEKINAQKTIMSRSKGGERIEERNKDV